MSVAIIIDQHGQITSSLPWAQRFAAARLEQLLVLIPVQHDGERRIVDVTAAAEADENAATYAIMGLANDVRFDVIGRIAGRLRMAATPQLPRTLVDAMQERIEESGEMQCLQIMRIRPGSDERVRIVIQSPAVPPERLTLDLSRIVQQQLGRRVPIELETRLVRRIQ